MTRYTLHFEDGGEVRDIDAQDASSALIVAHQLCANRSAELWRADRRLCTISREPGHEWLPAWFVPHSPK